MIVMANNQKILIYPSQYEHINRGCMENLLNRFAGSNIEITIIQCTNSHRACYLNKCLSNSGPDFSSNHLDACNVCVSNQSVFLHYAARLGIPCHTIALPALDNISHIPLELSDLLKFCLPSLSNKHLASKIYQSNALLSLCSQFCDSPEVFISLLRSVLGEIASIRKNTSFIETHLDLILLKLSSVLVVYEFIKHNVDFESYSYAYLFNGRFLLAKTLSIFCDQYSIPWSSFEGSFEWGPTASRYNLVDQASLQNFTARSSTLFNYAALNLTAQTSFRRTLLGCRSLKDRVLRKQQSAGYRLFVDHNFVHKDVGTSYVLFLTTSLFEFFLTDDFLDEGPSDQISMLKNIVLSLPESTNLVIREHPNSSGTDEQFKQKMRSLVSSMLPDNRFHFIASEEYVDTYLLMQAASVVIGSSSMALVEALFLSVPMYFLSPAIYSEYLPDRFCNWSDIDLLRNRLASPTLPTLDELRIVCRYFYDYNSLFGGQPLQTPSMLDLVPSRDVLSTCQHYDHLLS